MAQRDELQSRLQALAKLEQAQSLLDAGDAAQARALAVACLDILPTCREARDLIAAIDGQEPSGVRVAAWLDGTQAPGTTATDGSLRMNSGELAVSDDNLLAGLDQAVASGDDERAIAIGEMLAATGQTTPASNRLVAQSFQRLIAANDPTAIDLADRWAASWARQQRSSAAREAHKQLSLRIKAVQATHDTLSAALSANDLATLQATYHAFIASADRLSESQALITKAEQTLHAAHSAIAQLRSQVEAAIPLQLDQAYKLQRQLVDTERSQASQQALAQLEQRVIAVQTAERQLQSALNSGRPSMIQQAQRAFDASADRLSSTPALLQRAQAELAPRLAELERQAARFQAADGQDLSETVAALQAVAAIDPDHPLTQELPERSKQLARMRALHHDLEDATAGDSESAIADAVRRVTTSSNRLASTRLLINEANQRIADIREGRRRAKRRLVVILVLLAIGISVPAGIWFRDRSSWRQAAAIDDLELRLSHLEDWLDDGTHLFFRDNVTRDIATLRADIDASRVDRSLAVEPLEARITALQSLLADERYAADHTRIRSGITDAEHALDDAAWQRVLATADLSERIRSALDYVNGDTALRYADEANATIKHAHRELDRSAWEAIPTDGPVETRIAALVDYLETPFGQLAYRSQAERALARARSERDDLQWSQALAATGDSAQIAALQRYLADANNQRYRERAERRVRDLQAGIDQTRQRAADEAAWAAASMASGTNEARIAALQAYLGGNTLLAHAADAHEAIAQLRREADDQAWALASDDAGSEDDQLARLEGYLAGDGPKAHAERAASRIRVIIERRDAALWTAARGIADPGARLLALQAYLAHPMEMMHADEAEAAIRACLRRLSDMPGRELAEQPLEILVQLTPTALATLPAPTMAQLSIDLLSQLPPEALRNLPAERRRELPAPLRARMPRSAPWAVAHGVDGIGAWADLPIDVEDADEAVVVRLRFILSALDGDGTPVGGIWVSEREVDQGVWRTADMSRPPRPRHDALPMHSLRTEEWLNFQQAIAERDEDERGQAAPASIRLMTQAEWRLIASTAAAGAQNSAFPEPVRYTSEQLDAHAWHSGNSAGELHATGTKQADGWGLFDLYGNVGEVITTPSGQWLVVGGTFADAANALSPDQMQLYESAVPGQVGFRLVIDAPNER